MKLKQETFTFTLLTPCFSGGALGKSGGAAMRVPPIRGHIRDWHRARFGQADANRVWGAAGEAGAAGSRLALRMSDAVANDTGSAEILPHKPDGIRGERNALSQGQYFRFVAQRLPGCTPDDWQHARTSVQLWLLLGCLGYRANRAAGSVWPLDLWCPADEASLTALLSTLRCPVHVLLADSALGADAASLRRAASNTVSDPAFFGSPDPRKPSPLRFKVIQMAGQMRLLIVCPTTHLWSAARSALGSKPLGSVTWHPIHTQ